MGEMLRSDYHVMIASKRALSSRNKVIAMMLPFVAFPVFANEMTEANQLYLNSYQSYFHDEAAVQDQQASLSQEKKLTRKLSPGKNDQVATTNVKSSNVDLVRSYDDKTGIKKSNAGSVSLLRVNKNDPQVHWDSIGRNMEAGGLHGEIKTQIEIDDVRWSDSRKNTGKFKLTTAQAFLHHDELPNWYFGFWNAREDSYRGEFTDQDFVGANTINEFFVGHIFETWRGNIGAEVMAGSESAKKRWKNRIKVWQDLRVTDKWSLAGYAYAEYQPRTNQQGNNDLAQYIVEAEPAIQYRVNPDLGLFLRHYYYHNRQVRENWGDIIEDEWKVTAGFWKNWYPLLTSLYIGIGHDKKDNASNANELFYDGRYNFVGGTISYPVYGAIRLNGEFRAEFTKETGLWTNTGHSWNPFTVVGLSYNF